MNLPQSKSARVRGREDAGLSNNRPVQLTGIPIISPLPYQQQVYEDMRRRGESHTIAEMCALRAAPASRTDDDFFRGVGTLDKQIGDDENIYLNDVVSNYRKETGRNPNPNHLYVSGLAQYPGDSRAFVADRGEAKRRAEELNVNLDGFVTHKASEPINDPFAAMAAPQTKRAPIASDLKNLIADQMVKRDPGLKGRVNPAMIDEMHGNHVK